MFLSCQIVISSLLSQNYDPKFFMIFFLVLFCKIYSSNHPISGSCVITRGEGLGPGGGGWLVSGV